MGRIPAMSTFCKKTTISSHNSSDNSSGTLGGIPSIPIPVFALNATATFLKFSTFSLGNASSGYLGRSHSQVSMSMVRPSSPTCPCFFQHLAPPCLNCCSSSPQRWLRNLVRLFSTTFLHFRSAYLQIYYMFLSGLFFLVLMCTFQHILTSLLNNPCHM